MKWKAAKQEDHRALESYLKTTCTPVPAEHLRRHGLESRSRYRFYLQNRSSGISSIVYSGPGGFFYPLGLDGTDRSSLRSLRHVIGPFSQLRTIMGGADDVSTLDSIFKQQPSHRIPYERMYLDQTRYPAVSSPPFPGIELLRLPVERWKDLLPLQIAYEEEEVLLPGNTVNPQVSKNILVDNLTHQIVVVAHSRGEIIGRAGTNALGYRCAQIGGVYTEPRLRNRGIARWLIRSLLSILKSESKNAILFVKPHNEVALTLYQKTGFEVESDFQINYYY